METPGKISREIINALRKLAHLLKLNDTRSLDHLITVYSGATIEVRTKTGSSRCLQKFLSAGASLDRNVGSGEFVLSCMSF